MNNEIFREYDIRGNVERDLTDDVVLSIGRAFGSHMVKLGKKRASLCRDCRLSSEHYRDLLIEAMVESGLDVVDIGLAPTPLFYYSLFNLDVEGGIMVTGSHNPPYHEWFQSCRRQVDYLWRTDTGLEEDHRVGKIRYRKRIMPRIQKHRQRLS